MHFKGSFSTEIGVVTVKTVGDQLDTIEFSGDDLPLSRQRGPDIYREAKKQIREYACGKRTKFDLPFTLEGTPFQLKVWKSISLIPFGEKRTYKDLALEVQSPLAFRAVGGACHRNPLPLVIACHRVVGSSQDLTGFAGGLPLKKRLLDLEEQTKYK